MKKVTESNKTQFLGVTAEWIIETQFGDHIHWLQPIYEAITNSLEAKAENVSVNVKTVSEVQAIEADFIEYVEQVIVTDDGEGFNEKNCKSFNLLGTKHKVELGCKGVGRFTWLKIFEYVDIISLLDDKTIKFTFDLRYQPDVIKGIEEKNSTKQTKIVFSKFRDEYLKSLAPSKRDKRVIVNFEDIYSNIENHLWIKLHSIKEQGKKFNITITVGDREDKITSENLKELSMKTFRIANLLNSEYEFKTYYSFEPAHKNQKSIIKYCANGRTVTSSNIKIQKLEDNTILQAFITSDYLDINVHPARQKFTFTSSSENAKPAEIAMDTIEYHLGKTVSNIVKDHYPNLVDKNKDVILACIDEYPHLSEFIVTQDYIVVDPKEIVKKAKQEYDQKKEDIRSKIKKVCKKAGTKAETLIDALDEISHVQALELASYVYFRSQTINALQKLIDSKHKVEKDLHDLFMKMGTDFLADKDQFVSYDNNIWLLDDKFMSYCYAASDKKIKKIYEAIQQEYYEGRFPDREPDMALFFSDIEGKVSNALLIEFKAIGASRQEKRNATTEIMEYASIIRNSLPGINGIWNYVITEIDENFAESLRNNDFDEQYSNAHGGKIFHRYFNKSEVDTFVLSTEAIVADASVRNNVFLNIIKNKTKS